MLQTVKDRIIVYQISEEQTSGGILIGKTKTNKAKVVAVGPEAITVKIDNEVIIPSQGFESFTYKDKSYLVMPEENILAIL